MAADFSSSSPMLSSLRVIEVVKQNTIAPLFRWFLSWLVPPCGMRSHRSNLACSAERVQREMKQNMFMRGGFNLKLFSLGLEHISSDNHVFIGCQIVDFSVELVYVIVIFVSEFRVCRRIAWQCVVGNSTCMIPGDGDLETKLD